MTDVLVEETTDSRTVSIVTRIADQEGVSRLDLEPPLGHVIDVDALEALVSAEEDVHVEFRYNGYRVRVNGESVAVEELTRRESPASD